MNSEVQVTYITILTDRQRHKWFSERGRPYNSGNTDSSVQNYVEAPIRNQIHTLIKLYKIYFRTLYIPFLQNIEAKTFPAEFCTLFQNHRHSGSELQTYWFRILGTQVQNCRHTGSELQALHFRTADTGSELQALQFRTRVKPYQRYPVSIRRTDTFVQNYRLPAESVYSAHQNQIDTLDLQIRLETLVVPTLLQRKLLQQFSNSSPHIWLLGMITVIPV